MSICYFVVLYFLFDFSGTLRAAEVYVDSTNGRDEDCFTVQELLTNISLAPSAAPCKTINYALGGIACSRNCTSDIPIVDSTIRLSDGLHTLTGCVGISGGNNVTVEAENIGRATVNCVGQATVEEGADNIQSCMTQGLVFRGIVFEGCGPTVPNVFLNRSNDVLFEDCTFKLVVCYFECNIPFDNVICIR